MEHSICISLSHTQKFSLQDLWATPVSVSRLQKLPHSAVYDPASVYQLSTAAPSALAPVRGACAGSSLYRRPHARTRAGTHITEVSLVGPRLALSPEVGACVLCDRNVVLFLDKPLSGALERPRGRKWGTCDPHLPQQGCFSRAPPLGVALKAEKVPYLVPYVP